MADLYNLDAELAQGMMGTVDEGGEEDTNLENTGDELNVAISTDQADPNIDHAIYDDTSMTHSLVPVALREAATERQRIRRGLDKNLNNDYDDYEDDTIEVNKSNKNDSYLFDQQQEEKRDYSKQLQNLPYTHLYHAWVQECHAPELLPYPYATIEQIRDGLRRYENYICHNMMMMSDNNNNNNNNNNADGGDYRHNNRSNHRSGSSRHNNENLNALMDSLLRIDVERIKFLLSDLLKRRIQKITLHPQHYMKIIEEQQQQDENGEDVNENHDETDDNSLMCRAEITLLQNYLKIMKQHLSTTVTDHFPQEAWRSLDIPNDSVHAPNVQNQYVFIRCIENVTIPDSSTLINNNPDDSEILGSNFSQGGQQQQAGMCLIVRYERIRNLLLEGKVELI